MEQKLLFKYFEDLFFTIGIHFPVYHTPEEKLHLEKLYLKHILSYPNLPFNDTIDIKIPIIGFTNREWEFTEEYTKNKLAPLNFKMNLKKIITYQRYGKILRYPYRKLISGTTVLREYYATVYPMIYDKSDIINMIIRYELDNGYEGYIQCICINSTNFTAISDIICIKHEIYNEDFIYNIPTLKKVKARIPEEFYTFSQIQQFIEIFIYLYFMIYERPRRIRLTPENLDNTTVRPYNRRPRDPNRPVVHHVLLPPISHKRYEGRNILIDGHNNALYTTSRWSRIGHWRKNKNGERIWIDQTICNRKKELLSKDFENEIIIKL